MIERNEEQAIEEMRELMHVEIKKAVDRGLVTWTEFAQYLADRLIEKGYRKQSEGEWVETDYKTVEHGFVERRGKAWLCTNCRHASKELNPNMKFCPSCGAKMKGTEQ